MHEIALFLPKKEKGQLQNARLGKDLAKPHSGEPGAVNLTDPHLPHNVLFVPLNPPGVNPEADLPAGLLFDPPSEVPHYVHPGGPLRR